jgi:hypothetical protein
VHITAVTDFAAYLSRVEQTFANGGASALTGAIHLCHRDFFAGVAVYCGDYKSNVGLIAPRADASSIRRNPAYERTHPFNNGYTAPRLKMWQADRSQTPVAQ